MPASEESEEDLDDWEAVDAAVAAVPAAADHHELFEGDAYDAAAPVSRWAPPGKQGGRTVCVKREELTQAEHETRRGGSNKRRNREMSEPLPAPPPPPVRHGEPSASALRHSEAPPPAMRMNFVKATADDTDTTFLPSDPSAADTSAVPAAVSSSAAARMMEKMGYTKGSGLGLHGQGLKPPLQPPQTPPHPLHVPLPLP